MLFHLYLQVHMKEVVSAVWLQGLDLSYLREQVESLAALSTFTWPLFDLISGTITVILAITTIEGFTVSIQIGLAPC